VVGIAGVLAFRTRSSVVVGVAISITTAIRVRQALDASVKLLVSGTASDTRSDALRPQLVRHLD
jgi:hypothetical protein